jgi:hypothetical protein
MSNSVQGVFLTDGQSAQFMAKQTDGGWQVSVSVAGLATLDVFTASLTPWSQIDALISKALDDARSLSGSARRYPAMRVAIRNKPARDAKPDKAAKPTVRLPTDPINPAT